MSSLLKYFFIEVPVSVDPDQTASVAASELGLHCLHVS